MVIFLYNVHIFGRIKHGCLANIVVPLDPSNSVTKRLWCTYMYNTNLREIIFSREVTLPKLFCLPS